MRTIIFILEIPYLCERLHSIKIKKHNSLLLNSVYDMAFGLQALGCSIDRMQFFDT